MRMKRTVLAVLAVAFVVGLTSCLPGGITTSHPTSPINPTTTTTAANRIFSVNVKAAFLGTKFVVPVMKRSGGGSIINTASMAAVRPSRGLSAYASSKGALMTLTKALAVELSPHNIRVNCVCPALTDTPMIRAELEELKRVSSSSHPLPKLGKAEDVANAALFLASSESLMINGSCIDVDRGPVA